MKRNVAISLLKRTRFQLEARGIAHVALFGSVARDTARSTSDIDIVVTPSEGRHLGLFDLGGIQTILEGVFAGTSVDIIVEPAGTSALGDAIMRDRTPAF